MNIKSLESLAIHCSTKEEHEKIVNLLNKIDDRDWMNGDRNNLLNTDIDYKEDTCYGIYRNNFMSSKEASIFGYQLISYDRFKLHFTPKE